MLRPGGLGGTRRKHRPGFRFATKTPVRLRRRRRGAFSPSYPRRNERLMIPSGPPKRPGHGFPGPLRPISFQRAKVLRINNGTKIGIRSDFSTSPIGSAGASPSRAERCEKITLLWSGSRGRRAPAASAGEEPAKAFSLSSAKGGGVLCPACSRE